MIEAERQIESMKKAPPPVKQEAPETASREAEPSPDSIPQVRPGRKHNRPLRHFPPGMPEEKAAEQFILHDILQQELDLSMLPTFLEDVTHEPPNSALARDANQFLTLLYARVGRDVVNWLVAEFNGDHTAPDERSDRTTEALDIIERRVIRMFALQNVADLATIFSDSNTSNPKAGDMMRMQLDIGVGREVITFLLRMEYGTKFCLDFDPEDVAALQRTIADAFTPYAVEALARAARAAAEADADDERQLNWFARLCEELAATAIEG